MGLGFIDWNLLFQCCRFLNACIVLGQCLVVDVNGLAIIIAIIHHTFYVRMYYEAGVVPLGDNGLCRVLPILERCSLLLIHIHEQILDTFFTNLHPISFWLNCNLIIELNLVKLKMN